MSDKKIVAVVGATGVQGGGVARAILSDPEGPFTLRALTRDPDSAAAKALAESGAEVVRADVNDPASLETAFAGAYGAFLVTDYWAAASPQRETEQVGNLAQATARAGLAHVVWSTLEDTRELLPLEDERVPVLEGSYNLPSFDVKGAANKLFVEAGVPTTFMNTSFFFQNFLHLMGPHRNEDGTVALTLPLEDGKLFASIDGNDIGPTAYGILKEGESTIGETIGIAGDHQSGAGYAEIMGEAIGEPVRFESVPFEEFRKRDIKLADHIVSMFQIFGDFDAQFIGSRGLDRVRGFNPGLNSFRTWALENGDAFRAIL